MKICNIDECNNKHHGKGYCKKHYSKYVTDYTKLYENRKKTSSQLRQKLLEKFGCVCNCCGESEEKFLTIDHINNNGNTHRKNSVTGKRLDHMIVWRDILQNGTLKEYQTLCFNCNWAKQVYKTCPHVSWLKWSDKDE